MSENTIAFVFPGQGSQKVGMLAAAHEAFQSVRDTFAEASDVLGYDMWQLIQEGEQAALNLTETTQPVLLTSSVALWRAWLESGGAMPAVMAGHSLGEFSALVCSDALRFDDGVKLVRQRGAFMQSAVPVGEGAMAAIIGLEDAVINSICTDVAATNGGVVAAVNFNSPGQVVIAGNTGAVDAAILALKEAGAKRALPLPVSAPFHTQLMKPAGTRLVEAMEAIEFKAPTIPVVHNVHAQTEDDPVRIKALLGEQIYSPVQWTLCVQAIVDSGASEVVECGPGKVLSGLSRRIDKSLQSYSLEDPEQLRQTITELS
jgi:[acyl-carrier-protein] S-malonyltransferase